MSTANLLRERIANRGAAPARFQAISAPVPAHVASAQSDAFVPDQVLARAGEITRTEADQLAFGAIRVDGAGVIQIYNRAQAEFAGVDPEAAEGRNFFTSLAPCTNNRLFRGRFTEAAARGALDESFSYAFSYRARVTLVRVRLYRAGASGPAWIFLQPA